MRAKRAIIAIVLTVVATAAYADRILEISSDQPVSDLLTRSDDTLDDGSYYHVYRYPARRGEEVSVSLRSDEFDTYLVVVDDGEFREVNDDRGRGDTNSALTFRVDRPRDFYIIVTTYDPGATGRYTLTAVTEASVNAGWGDAVSATSTRESTTGTLESADDTLSGGEYYDSHRLRAEAGNVLTIELESDDFDTYLILIEPDGSQVDIDDARGSSNSYLERVLEHSGEYEILVTSYSAGERGRYTLSYKTAPLAAADLSLPGDAVVYTTRLPATVETLAQGEYVHRYSFTADAGQPVRFDLSSQEFDAYLILQDETGSWIEQNDDAGESTLDSRIEIRLARGGSYELIVTTYEGGETGSYTLESSVRFDNTPQAGSIAEATRAFSNPGPSGVRPPGAAPGYYGVFVGISDYPGRDNDLDFCAADAQELHDVFVSNRFARSDRVTLLRDRQATRARMLEAIGSYASQVRRDETLVIFFSGHGDSVRSSGERDGSDETIELYDGAILDDELAAALQSVRGRVILVVDACYSAGLAKDVITRPGWFGIFSSEEDVVSYVADEFRAGGYLSHFFQEAIGGRADGSVGGGRDRTVSMAELERYLFSQWYGPNGPSADSNQHLRFERNGVSVTEVLFQL